MAIIVPPAPIENPNFTSYTWVDWYQKVRNAINEASTVQWNSILGKPTTISGYGITNAPYMLTGVLVIPSSVSDGTATGVGTLNNAPTNGNPSKWLTIDDGGVTRYIPAW